MSMVPLWFESIFSKSRRNRAASRFVIFSADMTIMSGVLPVAGWRAMARSWR